MLEAIQCADRQAESITEGTLKQFNKQVGDFVKQDEEIASIETDKVGGYRRGQLLMSRSTSLSMPPRAERLSSCWLQRMTLLPSARILSRLSLEPRQRERSLAAAHPLPTSLQRQRTRPASPQRPSPSLLQPPPLPLPPPSLLPPRQRLARRDQRTRS